MRKLLVGLPVLALAAAPAAAQTNYDSLTGSVDFATAITALMTVAAAIALVLVARKGIRFVLGAIR